MLILLLTDNRNTTTLPEAQEFFLSWCTKEGNHWKMAFFWLVVYPVLAGLVIVKTVLLVIQTIEHRRYARSRLRSFNEYRPRGRAVVFAPCKGVDIQLESNLRQLLNQDYDDYEVTFIVESTSDPAHVLIAKLMAERHDVKMRLVVAGKSSHSGQKVHNLRVATENVPANVDYLVFVDSDAQPRREWLTALLSRLDRPDVGAATGYRWFLPSKTSLANSLLYSINCNIALLLGSTGPNMVWGGSWAIRRDLFETLGIRDEWEGTLSDDLIVSRALYRNRLRVTFEPACMVISPLDGTLSEMMSFVRRQYTIGRFYFPGWWSVAVVVASLSTFVRLASLAAIGFALATGTPPIWLPIAILGLIQAIELLRGFIRQDLIRIYFPEKEERLRSAKRFDIWLSPLASMVNWFGLLSSAVGRQITWRGITYRMFLGGRMEIVGRREITPSCESNEQILKFDNSKSDNNESLDRYKKAG